MTVGIIIGLIITIGSHCCGTMIPGHVYCLPPRESATDMDRPIRCSLLILECEEHLSMAMLKTF
jgi:hypothetical protein